MLGTQYQNYSIVLPVSAAKRARVVAAENNTSRSALMRDLLLEYLKEYDASNKKRRGRPSLLRADKPIIASK